jgi:H3 lysine-79-specific histone-lysine N-methyltransferase
MRVLPESDDSSEEDALDAFDRKRRRLASDGVTPDAGDVDVGRKVFCPSLVDERGEYGRGWAGFVPCEEAVRGEVRGWAGGQKGSMIKGGRDKYIPYFPQAGFENADPIPSVDLRYPSGAVEKFILLTPHSSGEYNPISELKAALGMILKHYIPPSHTHIFGTLEASDYFESAVPSRLQTPTSLSTPPPDGASPRPQVQQETIGEALRRALAPNRRDGPGFLKAMKRFNVALADLQEEGTLAAWLTSPDYRITRSEWSALINVVHDSAYNRVVAPFVEQLAHHPKHPEDVAAAISEKEDSYGELGNTFMSKVIEQTGLKPESVFVDLGSGVGNCVMRAAVQAGCASYGFELLPVPSHCARKQLREVQRRWAMWCLDGNLSVECHEGDFRTHPDVRRRLTEADVVLVNNEVFPSSLNMDLTHLFLDLKEGATIVSLKPFVPEGFRMNESNCDSFAAILRSTSHQYYSDWVSWKGDGGRYFVQVVDRTQRVKYEETMNGRRSRG